jgi:putative membrane protein
MYLYVKAIHIIFIVTWFAGLFYMPRLLIYHREAADKSVVERDILQAQLSIMMRRLWYGITWPSAILTIIFGAWMGFLYGSVPHWLAIKILFVCGLYFYHFTLQYLYKTQIRNQFFYSSNQLRMWNEIATILLVAIVMLVSVKQALSALWGIVGLVCLIIILISAIKIYKMMRK